MQSDRVHSSLQNVVPVPIDRSMNAQERQSLFGGDLTALKDIWEQCVRVEMTEAASA